MDLTNSASELEVVAPLSRNEQRALERAERTMKEGLRSFVAVGLALKEIRDRHLYRSNYESFEQYLLQRWQLSRPRGYQLCASATIMEDLSTIVHTDLLPANEAQTRALTRLKKPHQWRRAWAVAVKAAQADNRPVTAKDTDAAVNNINGRDHLKLPAPDGVAIYTCVQGDNSDLMAAVARLYLPPGQRIADITYGRGTFWNKIDLGDYEFHKSDKITCPASPHDFRKLPHKTGYFDAVVFDPPYAHHADSMQVEPNYNNAATSSGLYHADIMELYRLGMIEAKRILKPGGLMLVKCADEIESSKQKRGHIEVYEIAMELGLLDQDFFVLMRMHPPVIQVKQQLHARKNCSYLWVFKRPVR